MTAGGTETPVYDYEKLAFGHELSGPAIVEAPTTTVAIAPRSAATVDQLGNLVLHFK